MKAIIYKMMDHMKKNYDNSELSVIKLLKDSGYPGMKVLEFAFDPREKSNYLVAFNILFVKG